MLNKINRMLAGVGAAIAIVSITGCESTSSHKDERSEGRTIDDKNITASVKKSLDTEPAYKFNGVEIKTFAGVVSLSGFVNTDGQKTRAQDLAENTPGVTQVINGISLKPLMPAPTSRPNAGNWIYAEPQHSVIPNPNTPNATSEPK